MIVAAQIVALREPQVKLPESAGNGGNPKKEEQVARLPQSFRADPGHRRTDLSVQMVRDVVPEEGIEPSRGVTPTGF